MDKEEQLLMIRTDPEGFVVRELAEHRDESRVVRTLIWAGMDPIGAIEFVQEVAAYHEDEILSERRRLGRQRLWVGMFFVSIGTGVLIIPAVLLGGGLFFLVPVVYFAVSGYALIKGIEDSIAD